MIALTELVKCASMNPNIGFVSGKVYYFDRPNIFQTVGKRTHPVTLVGPHVGTLEEDVGQFDELKEYNFIDDVFLLVSRKVVEKIGGYDKNFFIQYEEVDFEARGRKAGFSVMYTPGAKVWHKVSVATGGSESPLRHYYNARNQIVFLYRHAKYGNLMRFLFSLFFHKVPVFTIAQLLKNRGDLISARLKGILDGFKWVIKGG